MANNLLIKDGGDVNRSVKTTEVSGIHTPHVRAEGPLTDAELRAAALTVSGSFLTNTQLRASAVAVSGPATNAELRATALPVSGPLTDAQLRASAVPVSGPITLQQIEDADIRTRVSAEESWQSGTFEVCPEFDVVTITIPEGALGVRICPRDSSVKFSLDTLPENSILNTLGNGGIAKPDVWKDVGFTGLEETLYLLALVDNNAVDSSAESSPSTSTCLVDVEFYGADAISS